MGDTSTPGETSRQISWGTRLLAPVALIVVVIAIVAIVAASTGEDNDDATATDGQAKVEKADGEGPENPRYYAVEDGDTLTGVAEKFDVSVKRLERLNPDIDPQTLGAGQELQIR